MSHCCEINKFYDSSLISVCYEEKGKLYVTDGYRVQSVNYCPFCGYKIKHNIKSNEKEVSAKNI